MVKLPTIGRAAEDWAICESEAGPVTRTSTVAPASRAAIASPEMVRAALSLTWVSARSIATVRSWRRLGLRRRPKKASRREEGAREERRPARVRARERVRGVAAKAVFRAGYAGRRLVRRRTVPSPSTDSTISSVRALRMVRPSPAALRASRPSSHDTSSRFSG